VTPLQLWVTVQILNCTFLPPSSKLSPSAIFHDKSFTASLIIFSQILGQKIWWMIKLIGLFEKCWWLVGGVGGGSGGGNVGQQTAAAFWAKFSGILDQALFFWTTYSEFSVFWAP